MSAIIKLETQESTARTIRTLFEGNVFLLLLKWFKETASLIAKEERTRKKLAPYVKQLATLAEQQQIFGEESRSRRSLREAEKTTAMEIVIMMKFSSMQQRYIADRDRMYRHIFLYPDVIVAGDEMLTSHAAFRNDVLEEEKTARYRLGIQYRVQTKEAILRTVRGELERLELRKRDEGYVEWEIEWLARYREFRLEDAMFQVERNILAQARVKMEEVKAREAVMQEASNNYWSLINGPESLEFWAEAHRIFLTTMLGRQVVDTSLLAMTQVKLLHVEEMESAARFELIIEESNTFHRHMDVLHDRYTAFCREVAALRVQRWARLHLSRMKVKRTMSKIQSVIDQRVSEEDYAYRSERQLAQFNAAQIILPFLLTRLSVKVRHDHNRMKFLNSILRFTEGFLTRKDLFDVWQEDLLAAKNAQLHLAITIQRIGRGCFAREELCDQRLELQEVALDAVNREREKLHVAALTIQWMYREWKLRRRTEEEEALAIIRRIQNHAAVKIQSLARRMFVRQFYTLLLVPRHRLKKLLLLQRVLRGAMVQKRHRTEKAVAITKRFMLSFLSRRAVVERRLCPFAIRIQCAFRCHLARRAAQKRRVRQNGKDLDRAKSSYAVLIQAAFRGHRVRKVNREAAKIAQQVRHTILEVDAANLEDDMWRIGRGYLARKKIFNMARHRMDTLVSVQSHLRAQQSGNARLVREEFLIEELCHKIMSRRVSVVQGMLRHRVSCMVVQQAQSDLLSRSAHAREVQHLLSRVRDGFLCRTALARQFQQRVRCALDLHRFTHGYRIRRDLCSEYVKFCCVRNEMRLHNAARRIQKAYRRHLAHTRIAAVIIQRSLVRRHWTQIERVLELRRERSKLYTLHRQSVVRYEAIDRSEITELETSTRKTLLNALMTLKESNCSAISRHGTNQLRVCVPESLALKLDHSRLNIEQEAVVGYIRIRDQFRKASAIAFKAFRDRESAEAINRCVKTETTLRERLVRDQLESRRVISLQFHADIRRMFAMKIKTLTDAEATDRLFISTIWQSEADVGLEKAYRALMSMLVEHSVSVPDVSVVKAVPLDDQGDTSRLVETATPVAALAPRKTVEDILRRPLQKFSTPVDKSAGSEVTDADLQDIFGSILQSSTIEESKTSTRRTLAPPPKQYASQTKASTARATTGAPAPVLTTRDAHSADREVARPRTLPPLVSDAPGLSILQPYEASIAIKASNAAQDLHVLQEKAKDEINFTAEGMVDSSLLGDGLCDETLPIVVSFVRAKMVTGLVLPRATMSEKGILHLIRAARAAKSPLSIIDFSHNLGVTDVVANHLVDLVEAVSSLIDVKIAGTSVSPGKRLLLFHALEQKRLGLMPKSSGSTRQFVALSRDNESMESSLPPIRFARAIQLPRRNGWSTNFKSYETTPNPEKRPEIEARLALQQKAAEEPDW